MAVGEGWLTQQDCLFSPQDGSVHRYPGLPLSESPEPEVRGVSEILQTSAGERQEEPCGGGGCEVCALGASHHAQARLTTLSPGIICGHPGPLAGLAVLPPEGVLSLEGKLIGISFYSSTVPRGSYPRRFFLGTWLRGSSACL